MRPETLRAGCVGVTVAAVSALALTALAGKPEQRAQLARGSSEVRRPVIEPVRPRIVTITREAALRPMAFGDAPTLSDRWPDRFPVSLRDDKAMAADLNAPPAMPGPQAVAPVAVPPAAVPAPAAAPKVAPTDVCSRHGGVKVALRGGRYWHCVYARRK